MNCGVKQAENKPHCSGLFFYTFFLCFELSKLVVYLLSLVVEVFIRVVGIASVHGGGLDVFVKRMPRPEHDRLQIATCLFRPGNVGIAEFMGMMLGEQSLERRLYRTQIDGLCFFEIDVWKNFSKHRGEGDFAFDFHSSLPLFARGADEEVLFRVYGFEFTPAQTAIEHDEQSARCGIVFVGEAELYESLFFGFSQGVSFLAFMIGQDDLLHGRDEPEIVSGEVEDAGVSEMQFLCRPEFPFVYVTEQVFLYSVSRHILEGNAGEVFLEVAFAHAFVFLVCTGLNRLLFENKPLCNVVGEENGLQ